jgi:uncharacterized protein YjaG (DUF416 family)
VSAGWKTRLDRLGRDVCIGIAAAATERVLPLFSNWAADVDPALTGASREALDAVWRVLQGVGEPADFRRIGERLGSHLPAAEEGRPGVAAARASLMDALAAATNSAHHEHVGEALWSSFESATAWVRTASADGEELERAEDAAAEAELDFQEHLIAVSELQGPLTRAQAMELSRLHPPRPSHT